MNNKNSHIFQQTELTLEIKFYFSQLFKIRLSIKIAWQPSLLKDASGFGCQTTRVWLWVFVCQLHIQKECT